IFKRLRRFLRLELSDHAQSRRHRRDRKSCRHSVRALLRWLVTSHLFRVAIVQIPTSAIRLPTETFCYSLPLRWPPLRVNLPRRNSWARLAPIRSAVPIAKFPKTSPAPRLDLG